MKSNPVCSACGHPYQVIDDDDTGGLCGYCFDDAQATLNPTHDFRDQGDPMVKRDIGSAGDWPNQPDGYQPGRR